MPPGPPYPPQPMSNAARFAEQNRIDYEVRTMIQTHEQAMQRLIEAAEKAATPGRNPDVRQEVFRGIVEEYRAQLPNMRNDMIAVIRAGGNEAWQRQQLDEIRNRYQGYVHQRII